MKRSKPTSSTLHAFERNFDGYARRFCTESRYKSTEDDLKVEFKRKFPNEVFKVRLSLKYNGTKYSGFRLAEKMFKDLGLDEDTVLVFPELPGRSSCYVNLYPAFFNCLKYLMDNLYMEFFQKTLLIHGVSRTGKSTLALCLALLLSISHGTCELFVFSGKSGSMDLYNESISSYIAEGRCPVIVDQCNLHNPNVERIFKENSSSGLLILFTSGNYAPEVTPFTTFDHVRFRVLELPVSQSDAKKLFDVDENKSQDIVAKTTIYGRLNSPEYQRNPNWETLFTNFHSDRFLNSDMGDKIKQALIVSEDKDLIYCDPIAVSELARAATSGGVKDESEVDFKLFFSMLEVKSKENVQRDDSDIFYHPGTYDYIIRYKEGIVDAYDRYRRSAEERNKTINLFKSIEQYQKADGSEKGKIFERIIDETCDAYSVALRNDGIFVPIGLRYVRGEVLSFVQVELSKKKVSSLDEVVKCIERLPNPNGMIWISFIENFKGFDFVNITVSERKVKEVQLLQMTTNLFCKGLPEFIKMREVCTELRTKLTTKQMLTDGTIIPFIILPFAKFTQVKNTKEKTMGQLTCKLKVVPYNLLTDIMSVIDSKAFVIV